MSVAGSINVEPYFAFHKPSAWCFLSILLTLLCLVSETPVHARKNESSTNPQTGSIKGKVVADIPDKQKTIGGVTVTLAGNMLANKKLTTLSDEEGVYTFTGLTAGDYVLSVDLQGFDTYEQKVSTQIGATVELNILLKPRAVTGT